MSEFEIYEFNLSHIIKKCHTLVVLFSQSTVLNENLKEDKEIDISKKSEKQKETSIAINSRRKN